MNLNIRDERLLAIVARDAVMDSVAGGMLITEGTIWHPEGYLVFSDLGTGTIHRWDSERGLGTIRHPSNIANGNFIDAQGRIVSCEHATGSITRIHPSGRYVEVLASHYRGKGLNSPNDLVIDSQQRIWFTDPTYGRHSPRVGVDRPLELDFTAVFRLDPGASEPVCVADDFNQPNGLCFSPDETILYVNDSAELTVRRFGVRPDGSLSGGETVITMEADKSGGVPDGMKVDAPGNLFVNGPGGVHVFTPDLEPLGAMLFPEKTRNFCFGGKDFKSLFVAASSTIFRVPMLTQGLGVPR